MPEKLTESLQKSYKSLQIADHLIYITFPLLKDKRLLLKSLDELNESLISIINAILQYDYLYKRIELNKEPRLNFQTFIQKSAPRIGISSEETNKLIEFFTLLKQHKEAGMEFLRKDKIVILSDNFHTETLTIEKIKEFLNLAKEIFRKAEIVIKRKI